MKKSLLALLLALVMCMSLFCTACSSGDDEDDSNVLKTEDEITPMTITLYAPTEGTTTQEQVEIVQAAFNDITQAKFNTNVILKLIPADKYDEVINTNIEALRKQRADQAAAELNGETAENVEEVELEIGSYPEEKENQMDIFMVQSFESFYKLAEGVDGESDLAPIDTQLAETAKLLSSYVYPYLLRSAKYDGETYGVLNNTVFADENGGYQYLLLNKELVDKYEYDPEVMKDLSSISFFLNEIKEKEPDVVPFLGELEPPVIYWDDTPSAIGAYVGSGLISSGKVDATSYRPEALYPGNLFNTSAYRSWWVEYNKLYQADCIVAKTEANANAKFAATIIDGDVTLSPTFADTYGNFKVDEFGFKYITDENGVDYYISVYKRPVADNNNVFNAGFVVSAYTEDVSRCMEIITALNTDAALCNLFMYGVQDVHYTIDEATGLVHKTTTGYAMDISTIGNIYLLKPSDDMDEYWTFMSKNGWENAKNTNREAVMSPFLGFYFNPEKPNPDEPEEGKLMTDMTFEELYAKVVELSKKYLEGVKTYRDSADAPDMTFERYIMAIRSETGEIDEFEQITDYTQGYYYMLGPYNEWYQKHYGVKLGLG